MVWSDGRGGEYLILIRRRDAPPLPSPTCLLPPHAHLLVLLLRFLPCLLLLLLLCLSTVNQESAEQERRLGSGATAATLERPRDEERACQRWRSDTSDSSILSDSPPNPSPPLPHTTITQTDKKKRTDRSGSSTSCCSQPFLSDGVNLFFVCFCFFPMSSHQGRRNKNRAGRVSGVSDKEERIDGMRTTGRHLLWRTTKILTHFSNPTIPCSRSVPGAPFKLPPSSPRVCVITPLPSNAHHLPPFSPLLN